MIRCGFCRTELPADALFCGECGRSVLGRVQTEPVTAPDEAPDTHDAAVEAVPRAEPEALVVPVRQAPIDFSAIQSCRSCGATLSPGDIFCGECGDVVRPRGLANSRPGDTAAIEPLPPVRGLIAPFVSSAVPPDAHSSGAHSSGADSARLDKRLTEILEDVEDTRIVMRNGEGERFVLQFSTGESVRVAGSGLIGRNPHSEPAEFVDQFVRVTDPTRSVSKTHLEFGQENGAFWVRDRYSGNGSVVREPDQAPIRCEPGRRYRLPRGTRVDIADQFFVVS